MGPATLKNKFEISRLKANWKDTDFIYEDDMRLSRRLKRRCIINENFNLKSCVNGATKTTSSNLQTEDEDVDEDYIVYLNDNHTDDNGGGGDDEFDASTEDNLDFDPLYKFFLENLKEDDKSYMLKVSVDDKIFHVKYEEEDRNYKKKVTLRSNSRTQKTGSPIKLQKTEKARTLRSGLREERVECPRVPSNRKRNVSLRSNSRKENTESPVQLQKTERARTLRSGLREVRIDCPRIMSRNVTLRSNSRKENTESPVQLQKTEKARTLRSGLREVRVDCPRIMSRNVTLRSNSRKENTESPILLKKTESARTLRGATRENRIDYPRIVTNVSAIGKSESLKSMRNVSRMETTRRDVPGKEGKQSVKGKNARTDPVFGGKIGYSDKRPGPYAPHSAKNEYKCQMQCDIVDKSYKVIQNYNKKGGGSMVLDENGESSSDSEIMILDYPYCNENTPFVPSKIYDSSCFLGKSSQFTGRIGSQFRKGLVEILGRPYDQEEYDFLLKEASCQRKKEVHKEMRSGRKSFKIDAVGQSYLDLYTDFADKIDQFSKCSTSLFLLRGFFYWLKNVAHEGAFRPWLDSSCLKMLRDMKIQNVCYLYMNRERRRSTRSLYTV
ncbi:dentin sialophosphoprotein-like [Quillaja saponaria]|uniref:Dentin sialophosphoprotein-like n=1 Tax=Quillaja saponaria TaxID=32244 RepID=A0AAD7PA35_QUISA|nr:dentin sialophosphoprotein-like [Quillaja saponaria]